jgi:4-alpha-glucanotransferase
MVLWEKTGRKILKALTESVAMQACAEDLGAVPPCVPAVLGELGIPGLRVLRWHRAWDKEGAPYVPLEDYPEESVACTSVHDSTNLRQWWEEEADRVAVWAMLKSASGQKRAAAGAEGPEGVDVKAAAPVVLDPDSAFFVLKAFAAARSRFVVYPLQDLMAASARHRETNPADERVNVPGTTGGANWLYRMKPRLDDLASDVEFASKIASLSSAR